MSATPTSIAPIVVMGVSGVGKSTVGRALADRMGRSFLDADDFHPPANLLKMASGQPLTDADREPWLRHLSDRMAQERRAGRGPVVACSALTRASRALLGQAGPDLFFVFLTAPRAVIEARLRARTGHFMPPSLLGSQLAALEEPNDALTIDACGDVAAIVERIARETVGSSHS